MITCKDRTTEQLNRIPLATIGNLFIDFLSKMEEEGSAKLIASQISDEISTTGSGDKQEAMINSGSNQEEISSSSSMTYYYSSFDLFTNNNPAFLKYRRFIAKLQHYLGSDWMIYANQVVYQQLNSGQRLYLDNQAVFESCLDIWLQMRREFSVKSVSNSLDEQSGMILELQMEESKNNIADSQNGDLSQKLQEINFSMFEENEMFEQFSRKFSNYFTLYLKDPMTQKPVLQGFFLGAIETWNYILRNPEKQRRTSDSFKQVLNNLQKKVIKPIMVVSQKITGYFGQKKPKEDQKELNQGLLKSFSNFETNINNEEEMLLEKMKQLQISDIQVDHAQESTQNVGPITLKKISDSGEKALNNAIVKFAQSYLQNIVNNTEKKWEVARGFVTNIIEVKYNNLQHYANDMKIKFLQPAQEFYNSLMETYILFKSNNYTNISFKDFLEKTKANLGNKWSDSLVMPTQVFFQTLIQQWNSILEDSQTQNRDDETIIRLFVQNVRNKMADSWDENIVRKAQEGIQE